MENYKETIYKELESCQKQLEVVQAQNNARSQIFENYRVEVATKLQQALLLDGISYESIIDIRDYFGDGKSPQISITFLSPRENYSSYELNITLRARKVLKTVTSGISTQNFEDTTEIQKYYQMVSDVLSNINNLENFWLIMDTWNKPEVDWVNDYELKEKIYQLKKELKIAELEIAEGVELEYSVQGRFGKTWIKVKVKNISSKTISVEDEWNTYRVKKEDVADKLRKFSA